LEKVHADIRIIAATNLDLGERMEQGLFRKDLYYRLRVGSIMVPSLCERPADIVPLAKLFLTNFAKKRGKNFTDISPEAAQLLMTHPWPGNVRELKNTLEWVSVMHDAPELLPEHLSTILTDNRGHAAVSSPEPVVVPSSKLKKRRQKPTEKEIDDALAATSGNKTQAALLLGISIRMLYYRISNRKDGKSNEK